MWVSFCARCQITLCFVAVLHFNVLSTAVGGRWQLCFFLWLISPCVKVCWNWDSRIESSLFDSAGFYTNKLHCHDWKKLQSILSYQHLLNVKHTQVVRRNLMKINQDIEFKFCKHCCVKEDTLEPLAVSLQSMLRWSRGEENILEFRSLRGVLKFLRL